MVTFNQSNEVLLYVSATANCSLISPTKPAHFHMEREGPGQLSIYNCCPATLDTVAQSEDSIQSCDTLLPSTPI